ncbi:hypothetical protein J32TS2_28000 [Shouchella clausii]|uniref:hypothetical protein n=1 Tax=Shouchella clausii TaxID=79880 RepID=UPI001B100EFE|nr:hypothetical protein [Shouchella clausii]GIN17444.1 hypothetical protein J32TS2_28000 [Shouchella clausii]
MQPFNKLNIDGKPYIDQGHYSYDSSTGSININFESKSQAFKVFLSHLRRTEKIRMLSFIFNESDANYVGPFIIDDIRDKSIILIRA